MIAESDAVDKMIEREKYRKISEKYRSKKNDRYRRRVTSKTTPNRHNEEEKVLKIPVRLAVCILLFGGFIYYINSGSAESKIFKEKMRSILAESIDFSSSENTVKKFLPWNNNKSVEVDDKTIKEMEESEYTPQFP